MRDLRFPVSRLLGLLASGQSREEILAAYPYLESADIDEALRYAASLAEDGSFALLYTPEGIDPVVDLSKFQGNVTAKWYNPVDGAYPRQSGPHKNAGSQCFQTPNDTHDWALLLESGTPNQ